MSIIISQKNHWVSKYKKE